MLHEGLAASTVRRLTGASSRMLDHWCWTGLILPTEGADGRRLYAMHDVIKIRALVALRRQGISLGTIRRCLAVLDERRRDLTALRLLVVDREVYATTDDGEMERLRDGQLAFTELSCSGLLAESPRTRRNERERRVG